MAVALSSVSNGSTVKIPLATGGTVDAVKVGYNHYSKSEAVLILQSDIGGGNFAAGYTAAYPVYIYENNAADIYCRGVKPLLASTMQGALVEVPIITVSALPDNYNIPNDSDLTTALQTFKFTTKTLTRSIFYPSARELGISTAGYYYVYRSYSGSPYGGTSSLVVPNNTGSVYSYLNSDANKPKAYMSRDPGMQLFSRRSGTTYSWYSVEERLSVYSLTDSSGNPKSMNNSNNSSDKWTSNVNYPISHDSNYPLGRGIVICLSGTLMVESSSGGAITESSAIESYRKINGKWYRTV